MQTPCWTLVLCSVYCYQLPTVFYACDVQEPLYSALSKHTDTDTHVCTNTTYQFKKNWLGTLFTIEILLKTGEIYSIESEIYSIEIIFIYYDFHQSPTVICIVKFDWLLVSNHCKFHPVSRKNRQFLIFIIPSYSYLHAYTTQHIHTYIHTYIHTQCTI